MENIFSRKKRGQKIISIVSTVSGCGKTTLIEGLIPIFKKRNYTVGVLKHDAHNIDIDKEGKDSYRFTHAGADNVVVAGAEKVVMIQQVKEEKQLEELFPLFQDIDILILEGFKHNKFTKIEVHRKGVGEGLFYNNPSTDKSKFLAIASNEKLDVDIPVLDLDNIFDIADFIERDMHRHD
ncbi:molybdopterin-guanine dinucleotide biosynthesis protein B [Clostridium cylindrosporum]|uniref:Molybdopterin-guanine dinucleotide biosynthesis adapter protein MobB n=1 Tax=Clostridium cylindrosporum DSM 605 TaxID=1121307 RepID=A0A0J8DCZ2_CLOCY|nr:molybdopterin-guanine dinucleotide biosynthesis protein B [Clostridium cylindrosporum]KMT22123.1 molybdopterin-guanine dinucleotide biosynthesis adapter protein MobB [Clostridium cylindrosporum DSM 605]